jgi:hypothetical protein
VVIISERIINFDHKLLKQLDSLLKNNQLIQNQIQNQIQNRIQNQIQNRIQNQIQKRKQVWIGLKRKCLMLCKMLRIDEKETDLQKEIRITITLK